MSRFKFHVFVCTNTRPEGGRPACAGTAIFAALQQEVARRPDLWDQVAITATGCLGPCFDGPTVVVYPEGSWYAHVTPGDAAEIVDSFGVGPVERLLYRWPQ